MRNTTPSLLQSRLWLLEDRLNQLGYRSCLVQIWHVTDYGSLNILRSEPVTLKGFIFAWSLDE